MGSHNSTTYTTVEERIIEKLKTDYLASDFLTDEDLRVIVDKGIREALFQPRRVASGRYNYEETDSPVIEAARKLAAEVAEQVCRDIFDDLMKNPEFTKALNQAIVAALPQVIRARWDDALGDLYQTSINQLQQHVYDKH